MSVLDMCYNKSVTAYERELERQKLLNSRADLLFKWLTILIAVFNVLISFIAKLNLKLKTNVIEQYGTLYELMMISFIVSFMLLLIINLPIKRRLPILGYELLESIQNQLNDCPFLDDLEKDVLYKSILEQDVLTKQLRSYNQIIAILLIIADIGMIIGIVLATIILSASF